MTERSRRLRLTGLRARLLGVVLLVVVPLAGLLFVYAAIESNAAQGVARVAVQSALDDDVRSVRDLVAQSQATLETFGITFAIQARRWDLAQGNAERLHALHPDYALVAVADPSGRILVSSIGSTGAVDVSGDAFFRQAVEKRGLVVSGYRPDQLLHRSTVAVALPVYDIHARLIAVEYVALDPSEFRTRLTPTDVAPVEFVIDASGTLVARTPQIPSAEGKRYPTMPLVQRILSVKRGEVTAEGFDGVTRQYFFTPVFTGADSPLFVASEFSTADLFAAQRRTLALTLGGFGAVALAALALAWAVATFSIYRPARALRDAAARVGGGDLSARVGVSRFDDEFSDLGRSFNAMAGAIQVQLTELERARHELAGLNADLEARVRRRTAELEASNKELEAFSYSVSHDLRSPLRAIDGFSQALLEDHSDRLDDEGRSDLNRVREATKRMGDLIDSLLQLSRLSRQEMRLQPVDLSTIAVETADSLRATDPGRDVTFVIAPGVHAVGDPVLLRLVLDNLIGNAWKFTGKHASARIEVGSEETGGETVYFVRDDGAGFDMAYGGKLFGAFQRVHGQADFPGIGIGLATTARIVHRHGGRIWAEGEPERGATFYFTLS